MNGVVGQVIVGGVQRVVDVTVAAVDDVDSATWWTVLGTAVPDVEDGALDVVVDSTGATPANGPTGRFEPHADIADAIAAAPNRTTRRCVMSLPRTTLCAANPASPGTV